MPEVGWSGGQQHSGLRLSSGRTQVEATSWEQLQLKAVMAPSEHRVLSLLSLLSMCFLLIPCIPTRSQVVKAVVPTGEGKRGLRGTKPIENHRPCPQGSTFCVGSAWSLPAPWKWQPATEGATEGEMRRQEQVPKCFWSSPAAAPILLSLTARCKQGP